jgi:uncharacterized protein (TIGR03083 family)
MVRMTEFTSFRECAEAFIELLGRIRPEQWDQPGLGVWTVRSLAGHTARAVQTVEQYLSGVEPARADIPDAETYYASVLGGVIDNDAVAERGVSAGLALGDDPVASVRLSLGRALSALDAQPTTRLVSVIGGRAILLTEYLRTRELELVVHTIDLSRATGIAHALPVAAVSDTAALAARLAVLKGSGDDLLLALTGRVALPEGFSVV